MMTREDIEASAKEQAKKVVIQWYTPGDGRSLEELIVNAIVGAVAALEKENEHLKDGLTLAGDEMDLLMEEHRKTEERIAVLEKIIA